MSYQNSVYNQIIKNNPLLTHKQEIDLSRKAQKGDVKAREKLIASNFRLVISIARKYHRSNFDLDDLIQESSTGLIKAVDKFDPEKGFKFSTYACWWIKQAAISYINEQEGSFKVPTHSRLLSSKINNLINEYEFKNNKKPSEEEIAELLGENVKKIKYTIEANKKSVSMDNNSENDDVLSIKDKISDDSLYSNPEENLINEDMINAIKESLNCLTSKEEKIIRLRFGIGESVQTEKDSFKITKNMINYLEDNNE